MDRPPVPDGQGACSAAQVKTSLAVHRNNGKARCGGAFAPGTAIGRVWQPPALAVAFLVIAGLVRVS